MDTYKNKYFKYKLKYLKLGGKTLQNKEKYAKKFYDKFLKQNIENYKKKYENKFNKGLKRNEMYNLCDELYKLGHKIEQKYKINKTTQLELLKILNKKDIYNNDINIILLRTLINNYVDKILEGSNDKSKLKYLISNSKLKLDNNKTNKYITGELLGRGSFGETFDVGNNQVLKIININNYKIDSDEDFLI